MERKNKIAGFILLLVIICAIAFYFNSQNKDNYDVRDNKFIDYAEVQKETLDLCAELGEEDLYPQIYLSAENRIKTKNASKEEAVSEAIDEYLKKQALVWYAGEKGITATEKEIEDYIYKLILDAGNGDDYDELAEACEYQGIEVRDIYEKNKLLYRDNYLIEKLYNFWKEEYVNILDSKEKNKAEEYDDIFKKNKEEALKAYKDSQDYVVTKAKVEECRNKYLKQK